MGLQQAKGFSHQPIYENIISMPLNCFTELLNKKILKYQPLLLDNQTKTPNHSSGE
jgi:hypothetical protein